MILLRRIPIPSGTDAIHNKYGFIDLGNDTLTEVTNVPKRRIESLDILRGGAIIGVITVHIMFGAGRTVDGMSAGLSIAEFLYAALAMFMVISGYLYKSGKDYRTNMMTRVLPILIILGFSTILFTTLMYGYLYVLGYDLSQYNLLEEIGEVLVGKGCFQNLHADDFSAGYVSSPFDISAGYYYLQILAVGYVIFFAIADLVLDDWRKCLAAIVSLFAIAGLYVEFIGIQLPFTAQIGPVVAAFLLVGALMKRYDFALFMENGFRKKSYWLMIVSMAIIGVICVMYFPTGMRLYNSQFGAYGSWSVITFPILSLSCGIILWFISVLLIRVPIVSDIFRIAGIASIVLYSMHMFIAKLITAPLHTLGTEYWITLDSIGDRFILLIVTLSVLYLITFALYRIKRTLGEGTDSEDYSPSGSES